MRQAHLFFFFVIPAFVGMTQGAGERIILAMETPPQKYIELNRQESQGRIAELKRQLGSALCILGHHYQRDEVIQFADFTGDSLELSQLAADQREAKYIVFCGVHFMAESADILSTDEQTVCLPNLRAGCAMADMADAQALAAAMDELGDMLDDSSAGEIVPVSYVNSTAAIKAITAQFNGACCTSSNVRNVFHWALADAKTGSSGGRKIFAIPDEHLARNTAIAMGFAENDCVLYDQARPNGGISAEQLRGATFILWKGHCYVHQLFTVSQIGQARERFPDVRVMVHPECPREVVTASDASGSTSQIIQAVDQASAGTIWAIGTEENLVRRLARKHPEQTIFPLSEGSRTPARCVQMAQIDLPHLLWSLESIAAGEPVNVIRVDADIAADAKVALQRMIGIE